MSDTSLVFNLVARDRASETLGKVREKFDAAATGIAAGVAGALGVGVAASLDMSAANAKLAAQLGVGPAEAAKLSKVSSDVYANAWGDSTETVNEAIKGVYQNIGSTAQAKGGLEGLTTKALALAETFDQEVGPTTAAVGQMLKTGLAKNADEAFDILTKGFQTGANKADDLLDTVNEYGVQWKKFGLDGKTAMGLLSQGLKGGARDADLVADSIKEFSIRAIDGSTSTAAGFKAIGLDADNMAAKIAKGGSSASGALDLTLDKLRAMPDKNKRAAAAVQLFGTQAEDLGDALYKLDPSKATDTIGKVGGAADKMAKTVGGSPASALESFKRTAIVKLAEISGTFISFAMDNSAVFPAARLHPGRHRPRGARGQGRHDGLGRRPGRVVGGHRDRHRRPMGLELGAVRLPDHLDHPRRPGPGRRDRHHRHQDHLLSDRLGVRVGLHHHVRQRRSGHRRQHPRLVRRPARPVQRLVRLRQGLRGREEDDRPAHLAAAPCPGSASGALAGLVRHPDARKASDRLRSHEARQPPPRSPSFIDVGAWHPGPHGPRHRLPGRPPVSARARTWCAACGTASSPWAAWI
jgi:hypothetical protein